MDCFTYYKIIQWRRALLCHKWEVVNVFKYFIVTAHIMQHSDLVREFIYCF